MTSLFNAICAARTGTYSLVGFLPQEKEKKRNRHHSGILKAVFLEPGADGVYPGMPGGTHDNGRHKTDHRTGNGDREDETAEKNDPKRLQEGRIAYGRDKTADR